MVVDYGINVEEAKLGKLENKIKNEIELQQERSVSEHEQEMLPDKGPSKIGQELNIKPPGPVNLVQMRSMTESALTLVQRKHSLGDPEENAEETFWLWKLYYWIDGLAPQSIKRLKVSAELYNSFFVR
ncbi:hypothetical protein RFI_08289 [Reticulomyxa filosa]|uniref:Uncharacterized protein n=1 Tax=Reticulomyxa filosa TaxID=46433 RepID=X6NS64_RETFI|nr:hypothetical protein RFI_08289 [Reticulomyxa filosa]|eukprot:ETO28836.1 hypothetical protein RFI_08289 [Reticulomyxa filosa]